MATERLQKILARGGLASRRAAEELIKAGRVRINGRVTTELGTKADPANDKIEVDGKRVVAEQFVYIALHKPRGMVSTMSDPEGRPTVAELLTSLDARVYPVGRLDFATSGILLATNDGDFANGLLHPKKKVPKTYVLKLAGQMGEADVDRWRNGVDLEDGKTLPAQVKFLRHEAGKTWLEVTIREGRNQQIRRMGEATGFPVMRLARTTFAGISSEGLAPGKLRGLSREELTNLKKEYGVPKRVNAMGGAEAEAPRGPVRRAKPISRSGERGAARGDERSAARSDDRGGRAGRGASRSEPSDRGRGGDRGASRSDPSDRGAGRGGERANDKRPGTPSRREQSRAGGARGPAKPAQRGGGGEKGYAYRATEAESPRLGGGAPGRRGSDVREDWGGGSGRGRSGSRDGATPSEAPPPGRGGRTPTTGTGGGVGAGQGSYRMEKRRGRG